jgi:hypothetical protein
MFSASVPACIFFVSLFAGYSQCSNRGNLTWFFLLTKLGGFFFVLFFLLSYIRTTARPLLHVVDYRKVRTAEPRDASRPAVLPPCTAAWHDFEVFYHFLVK